MEDQMMQLEYEMWEAASHRDVKAFQRLVPPDAVMVCGGYRCLGAEYATYISGFDLSSYSIHNMERVHANENEALLHYTIHIEVEDESAKDLAGDFHVVSFWKKQGENWRLSFNMDSKISRP